jgi:cell division protein FtsQ
MPGRRRLTESAIEGADARSRAGASAGKAFARRAIATSPLRAWGRTYDGWARVLRRWLAPLENRQIPRGAGTAVVLSFMVASTSFGVVRGGHLPEIAVEFAKARDAAANALGFRITSIALAGQSELTREEILAIAGVTGRTSLLFLDAAEARSRLKGNPWIAEATVLKLYPGRLHITVTERQAFALWQKDGKITVIADDGTVVEPYVARRFTHLPLVVGVGAETKAKEFLALIDRFPLVRDQMRAAVLVAERRWNLQLKSKLEIKLPETEIAAALATLVQLDREKQVLSRDLAVIDLRLPDRVTVQLTDEAWAEREALKKPPPKKKGSSA